MVINEQHWQRMCK